MLSVRCEFADGLTLATFGALMEKRRVILGESAKDALVACGIDALVSLRAATKTAIKKNSFATGVESTGWYGGFSQSLRKPCIRQGWRHDSPRVDVGGARVKFLTHGVRDARKQRVFKVTPEHRAVAPYYVVCESKAVAKAFEKKCAMHRVGNLGNLAKNALGVAMAKLSTRNVAIDGSSTCVNAASRLSDVARADGVITITDKLGYSVAALKGGAADVQLALQKAANKIAGRLQKEVLRRGLKDHVATPFPEVRARKGK